MVVSDKACESCVCIYIYMYTYISICICSQKCQCVFSTWRPFWGAPRCLNVLVSWPSDETLFLRAGLADATRLCFLIPGPQKHVKQQPKASFCPRECSFTYFWGPGRAKMQIA